MKFNLSRITAIWVFVAGLILASTATMFEDTAPTKAPVTMAELKKYQKEKTSPRNRVTQQVDNIGILLITTSSIVGGIRRVRKKQWANGILLVLPGIAICTFYISMTYFGSKIAELADNIPAPNLEQMKDAANNTKLPLRHRAMISTSYAREIFLKDGVAVEIVTEKGERKLYVPTSEDKQLREMQLVNRTVWPAIKKAVPSSYIYWFAIGLGSILTGVLTPIRTNAQQQRRP